MYQERRVEGVADPILLVEEVVGEGEGWSNQDRLPLESYLLR
jgi:hypothetical protein